MKLIASISLLMASALFFPTPGKANDVPAPMQDLYQDGIYHKAACEPSELARLKKLIGELSTRRDPDASWDLIETFLCGEGKVAEKYIMNHMPEKIALASYDWEIDKDIIRYIPRSPVLMRKKRAWNTNARAKGTHIEVSFMPKSYCVMSFQVEFRNEKWSIVRLGRACD